MNSSFSEPVAVLLRNSRAASIGAVAAEPYIGGRPLEPLPSITLHIVDGDAFSRAEQARTAFALGLHAEVYDSLDELCERPPRNGIVMVRQIALEPAVSNLMDRLGAQGVWLPVVVCAAELQAESIVSAIKEGALDYLQLPLEHNKLARSVQRVLAEAIAQGAERAQRNRARQLVESLSRREREVLELLSEGTSNKEIGRLLEISPRTVEIHRGNMMAKMGAGHVTEAVRLWLAAELESAIRPLACNEVIRQPEPLTPGLKAAA